MLSEQRGILDWSVLEAGNEPQSIGKLNSHRSDIYTPNPGPSHVRNWVVCGQSAFILWKTAHALKAVQKNALRFVASPSDGGSSSIRALERVKLWGSRGFSSSKRDIDSYTLSSTYMEEAQNIISKTIV